MIHKIHAGEHLPSVAAGGKYEIIGFQNSVHDYSTVVFPQPINNCLACHSGEHADQFKTTQSREVCTSCHDNITFEAGRPPEGMMVHTPGPLDNDEVCVNCHFDGDETRGVPERHFVGLLGPERPNIELAIQSVTNTGPGQAPQLRFTVEEDGRPRDILASPLSTLRVTVAGPTTDYASYWQATIQPQPTSPPANIGTLVADGEGFLYTFPASAIIPLSATGSYAVALEGAMRPDPAGERFPTNNPIAFVAVTDTQPVARREVVEMEKCNNCHGELVAHGGQRVEVQYCAFCHNPNNTNDDRVARFEGTSVFVHSVNLKDMIHKIHMGEHLTQKPYVLGGNPTPSAANPAGTPVDFSHVRFPRPVSDCSSCHTDGGANLPLAAGLLPTRTETLTCTEDGSADADLLCTATLRASDASFLPPESAACTSCHDSPSAVAHAELNRTASGLESCATCHGPGAAFDAAIAHSP
jgi:OmcA/MtrC family decaheme c-type cytochrome